MKKVAVFVEGQGELIFVRNLLYHLIDPSEFSFECIQLYADTEKTVPYEYSPPNATVHFRIINVGTDEKVLTAIKEREKRLFEKGFTKIVGLRDMYSGAYCKRAEGIIDEELIQKFVRAAADVITEMNNLDNIHFHFAIMEMEAWWLSMYNLFSKIDGMLTSDFIKEKMGYDLAKISPEKTFFHPSSEVDKILKLARSAYNKKFGEVEKITKKIEASDIDDAKEHGRCKAFEIFCKNMTSC